MSIFNSSMKQMHCDQTFKATQSNVSLLIKKAFVANDKIMLWKNTKEIPQLDPKE